MAKCRLRFPLRTLFLVVGMIAIGLSVLNWFRSIQLLPQQHHYTSLEAGYTAVRIQFPDAKNWATGWTMWPERLDRKGLEEAFPYWEKSLRHAQLADHYLQVSERPWIALFAPPEGDSLPPLPDDDSQLWLWWDTYLSAHVQRTGLNCNWGGYWDSAVNDRNLAFLKIDSRAFNKFLRLYDIWPGAEPADESEPPGV